MTIKEYVSIRKEELKKEIKSLATPPTLSIITIGHDPASEAYVRGKKKDAAEVGIKAVQTIFDEKVSEEDVLSFIRQQNNDRSVTGILVQLPIPRHIKVTNINLTIDPSKDVDGFTPGSHFDPCTPKGIVNYLKSEGFAFQGKNAVVLGRSDIVGKPMSRLLLNLDCNVTTLHSKTNDIDKRFYLKHADIVVVAIGRMHSLDESYEFKKEACVVDVGITRGEDNHLYGDCVPNLPVKLQTPVPGGVGLLTRLALLENLLLAYKEQNNGI